MNTRPRDFYDVFVLTKTQNYNKETLKKALFATASHRGTKEEIEREAGKRLSMIEDSEDLRIQWQKYQKKFPYAKDISYDQVVKVVKEIINEIQYEVIYNVMSYVRKGMEHRVAGSFNCRHEPTAGCIFCSRGR